MPIVTATRLMTGEERAMLPQPIRQFGWWTGIVSAACAFILAFLVGLLPANLFSYVLVVRTALVVAAAVSIITYVVVQRRERKRLAAVEGVMAGAASQGIVRSTIYTIRDAVAVEELEDEGLHYYLLLDDGRTLFLSGQYLYDAAKEGFPWQSFEMVAVPPEDWVLRIVPLGPSLTDVRTRPPFSDAECDSDSVPQNGTIETMDFAALKAAASGSSGHAH
jgi:hypothetical protein